MKEFRHLCDRRRQVFRAAVEEKVKKLKNIEFLRVVGCLAIVVLHFCSRAGFGKFAKVNPFFCEMMKTSNCGAKAVDLFFILAGIFLVLTTDFRSSFFEFVKKKLIRFLPVPIFTLFGFFVLTRFCDMKFRYCENFLILFNVTGTPLSLKYGNFAGYWYISVLFWVFLFIFYCRQNFSRKAVDLWIALLVFFSYAFVVDVTKGYVTGVLDHYGYFFNVGLARGIGGVGIGYFIGEWYRQNAERIRALSLPFYSRLIFTAAEGYTLFFIIREMMFHKPRFANHFVFIICFAIIIICFLLKQGYISRLLDAEIWCRLSAYTFSVYVTHTLVRDTLITCLWKTSKFKPFMLDHPCVTLLVSIAAALIFGIATCHLVERPATKYLKRFLAPKPCG